MDFFFSSKRHLRGDTSEVKPFSELFFPISDKCEWDHYDYFLYVASFVVIWRLAKKGPDESYRLECFS